MNVLFNAQHFHDREIMKRARASEEPPATKKRKVGYSTYQKWRRDFDGEYGTITWLACETEMSQEKRVVVRLNCSVCTKYNERIMGRRNYSNSWIVGAESIRTSNIRDHAKSDQHCHAMSLRLREQATARGECSSSMLPLPLPLQLCPMKTEQSCDASSTLRTLWLEKSFLFENSLLFAS